MRRMTRRQWLKETALRGARELPAGGARILAVAAATLLIGCLFAQAQPVHPLPRLVQQHGATQILVDGKPFLIRGGELENSSASSLTYLDTIWPKVVAMHFNTVLAPVYWQLIEPREGQQFIRFR